MIEQIDSITLVMVYSLELASSPFILTPSIAGLLRQGDDEFERTWLQLPIGPTQRNQIVAALQKTILLMLLL